jgi:hypothetical protein
VIRHIEGELAMRCLPTFLLSARQLR